MRRHQHQQHHQTLVDQSKFTDDFETTNRSNSMATTAQDDLITSTTATTTLSRNEEGDQVESKPAPPPQSTTKRLMKKLLWKRPKMGDLEDADADGDEFDIDKENDYAPNRKVTPEYCDANQWSKLFGSRCKPKAKLTRPKKSSSINFQLISKKNG